MTFRIITLGCKVNAYESEIMREKLEEAGYVSSLNDACDIVVINTCSVTNVADKKSQKMVRSVKRSNPHTVLIVAGCSSENKEKIYQDMNIDILLGNKDKSRIVELLNEYFKNHQKIQRFYHTRNLPFEDMTIRRFTNHTRAFLKIQDGCNNFCSYCIIPYVRGTIRFKDFDKAIEEAKMLVEHGHQEIVLTGIHTGSYGTGLGYDLTDLIQKMSELPNLKRIRISSIEITELNDKFLEELKNNPKICDHLHIPLQAGSDEILKKMNRKYDLEYFEEKLKKIRKIRPNISITTDIIVGHPYETEDLFQETLHTAKKLKFSKIHAFPFSLRDGTAAAQMDFQVSESEKKTRNHQLLQLSSELEHDYASSFLYTNVDVLIEEVGEDYSIGHTSNYLKVKIYEKVNKNQIYTVFLKHLDGDAIVGEMVPVKS